VNLVYLDAAASTPLDPKVLAAMVPVLAEVHANPHSSHWAGQRARVLVQGAREAIAALVHRGPAGVTLTSGATEANNLVLRGLCSDSGLRRKIVSSRVEHPSVLRTLSALAATGAPVELVDVDERGRLDPHRLREAVDDTTLLVTLMAANNETGVLTDLAMIADITHEAGALLHTDASQILAWGPLPAALEIDLVTVSAHKMHGPQGVGALIASAAAREHLVPILNGGGQEGGLRSGTVNVAGAVGLGAAAAQAMAHGPVAETAIAELRDDLHNQLIDRLAAHGHGAALNGDPGARLPGVLNLAFGDADDPVDAEAVLAHCPQVAASTGSACSSGSPGPSPVLLAMGLPPDRASSSVRFSLSRMTTRSDVNAAIPAIADAVLAVRALQRRSEMVTCR
jgi:cysteine desulfurase